MRRPAPRRASAATGAPWWRRRWLWLGLALAALFMGNEGFRGLVSRWRELRRFRRELAALDAEEADLRRRLDGVRRGDAALERAARKELGYLKPGEVEYRFPPPAKTQ